MNRAPGWGVALAAAMLAACRPPVVDSGVEGRVWVGPTCPVVQEGVECPDAPLEADLEVVDDAGRIVARARSDAEGAFRMALAPGAYTLVPLSPSEAGMPFAAPLPFEVQAGRWTELDVFYDSGIR